MIEIAPSAEGALYSYLAAAGIAGGRIYPHKLPANAILPAVAYQTFGNPQQTTHQGPSSYHLTRIQLSIMAETYTSCITVCQQIRTLLDGASGTWAEIKVQSCLIENEIDGAEPLDTMLSRRIIEVALEWGL